MFKKLLIFFLVLSRLSFSRFVNQCKVLGLHDSWSFRCRSLETGKVFYFAADTTEIARSFRVGRVYKIWFQDQGYYENGVTYYHLEDWILVR